MRILSVKTNKWAEVTKPKKKKIQLEESTAQNKINKDSVERVNIVKCCCFVICVEPLECLKGHDTQCWPQGWNRRAIFFSPHWTTSHFFRLLGMKEGMRNREEETVAHLVSGIPVSLGSCPQDEVGEISCCYVFWMVNSNFVSLFLEGQIQLSILFFSMFILNFLSV